ncbi:hypothetical protein V7147_16540, partial [Bacillus sp. JJ1521]|uniref:hypothetical protein n=1 Tax=Bacillus sp. JJ1521 TaxID=3122957 RepID=UPI002FFE015F
DLEPMAPGAGQYKRSCRRMVVMNKIALFFVILYSGIILMNTYLGETERVQSNVVIFVLNGFAYIVSAMEIERDKQHLIDNQSTA